MKKVKFGDIVSGTATIKGLHIDPSCVRGFPKHGVELVGAPVITTYKKYDENNKVVPGSEDPSRIVKIKFSGYNLHQLNRIREDLKNGDIDQDEYEDEVAELSPIELTIPIEEDCMEFKNLYAKLLDGLADGKIYDITSPLAIVPVWANVGWDTMTCTFADIENLKVKEFDSKTLKPNA